MEAIVAVCLAVITAGLWMRIRKKTMIWSFFLVLFLEIIINLIAGGVLSSGVLFLIGAAVAAICLVIQEKRRAWDGFLTFCVAGSIYGLWTVFHRGMLYAAEGEDIVLFVYSLFYLLHFLAVLLSYRSFSLPEDWCSELKGKRLFWIPLMGMEMLTVSFLLTFLSYAGPLEAVLQILLSTLFFWLNLVTMTVVANQGRQSEINSRDSAFYQEMNTFMNVVRSQRHDYNLHVQTVASLIARKKWEECRQYVNALVLDTTEMNEVLPVKDPAVAGLIHNYRMIAAQKGITLELDIRDDMENVVTDAYKTNKIIGNLLQNALDEVSQHPEGEVISLMIVKRGEYCMVSVVNSISDSSPFIHKKDEVFRQGFTTKQGHDGVGLSSIRFLARQIGGDVTAWVDENKVHFVASIPMRLAHYEES